MRPHAVLLSLAALLAADCGGPVPPRTVRQQIAELGDARLTADEIEVRRIVAQTGGRAIAETTVQMAFEFERDAAGEWRIVAARLGDRQWIPLDDLLAALAAQRQEATRAALAKLEAGLETYRREEGALPDPDAAYVPDLLHPRFMPELVREDAWGASIGYERVGDGYRLRSPGPDGIAGTADDIVAEGAPR